MTGDLHGTELIRIEFEVTADDAVDATRAYAGYRSRPAFFFGLGLAIAGVLLWGLTGDLYFLALTLAGAIAIGVGRYRVLDRAFMRAQPATRIGTHTEMSLEERGLHFEQAGVEGIVDWSAVTELRDGERSLVLLQGRVLLAYIPKRAFATEAELEAARVWIKRRIGSEGAKGAC